MLWLQEGWRILFDTRGQPLFKLAHIVGRLWVLRDDRRDTLLKARCALLKFAQIQPQSQNLVQPGEQRRRNLKIRRDSQIMRRSAPEAQRRKMRLSAGVVQHTQ